MPAKPKATPDYRRFSLRTLLEAHYAPEGEWEIRERAENSARCVEVIRAARPADAWMQRPVDQGVVVPDKLLIQSMGLVKAAITTRTTAAGVDDTRVAYDSVIGQLIDIGECLPHCRVFTGLNPPEALPQVNFARGTFRNVAENTGLLVDEAIGTLGAAHTDAVTTMTLTAVATSTVAVDDYLKVNDEIVLVTAVASQSSFTIVRGQLGTVAAAHADADAVTLQAKSPGTLVALNSDKKTLTPHTIRGNFQYTAEVAIGSRMTVGPLGIDEGIRIMAGEVEDGIALGTGLAGQVSGFETLVTDGNTVEDDSAIGNSDLDLIMRPWMHMTDQGVPIPGRFWVVDSHMSNWLYGGQQGGQPLSLDGMTLKGKPMVESSRISRSARTTGARGVAWLLYGPEITVGFFGEDTEVSITRVDGTSDWDVVLLKFWDVAFRRSQVIHRFVSVL